MTHSINESINDEAVYRTALATPGLLKNAHYPVVLNGKFNTLILSRCDRFKDKHPNNPGGTRKQPW